MPRISQNFQTGSEITSENLRSEAVNELVSNDPGFIIRYGIAIFGIIMFFIILHCAGL